MSWSDLIQILPELILTAGGSLLLLIPVGGERLRRSDAARWVMLLVLLAAAVGVVVSSSIAVVPGPAVASMFALDGFAVFFKLLFIMIIAVVTLLSGDFLAEAKYSAWEYYGLMAFALTGMCFMASGIHLISIYVGLELLSLSSYILAGYFKGETRSTEAAVKYLILGAVSSGILLYGMSLIYGVAGSLSLKALAAAMLAGRGEVLIMGVLMLTAGLCFKVAAVPFHVWTPDVYVGAPTPITAFLSTASKAAGFAIFARIFYVALASSHAEWSGVLAAVSAMTMIIGNLAAVTQDNVKRMLAYSSIGHAGYGLLGILAMSQAGLYSVLVYMLVYTFANLGIWATILLLKRHQYAGEAVEDFEGLSQRAPFLAFAMVVFLLSLGGIPPTAGFIGKYFLFSAAISAGYTWLAVIGVLMSAVSMFYYLRLVVAMYLKEGRLAIVMPSPQLRFAVILCLVVTLVIGVLPEQTLRGVRQSIAKSSPARVAMNVGR